MEKKVLENEEDRKQKKTEKTPSHARWVIRVFLIAVALSAAMSLCSGALLEDAGYVVATLILLLFIALGILFDIIGVAVTAANPKPFNSMAAHRVKGAKEALYLPFSTDVWFGPPWSFTSTSTCSWIGHPVSGLRHATIALFRLAFASAPNLQFLTLLHNVTRRSVLQKVRDRALLALSLLVNTGFQVLFHSPPGVLFTFPSRYYALSVTNSYLGLGGGPPGFPPDFSCPAVLWCQLVV